MEERCACGQPLHYSSPDVQEMVERLIASAGSPHILVTIDKRHWLVQRHYLALHGISARDLLDDKVPGATEVFVTE